MAGSAPSFQNDPYSKALPEALAALINRVVRATWLWTAEKRDVKAELESHFREGLHGLIEEGLTLEESVARLRDEFGNPELAAKLIRRGKKRGRPMIWKMFASLMIVGAAALVAGAGYVGYIALGKPTPTVDYVAKINEPTAKLPQSDFAWPPLREVVLQMASNLEPFTSKQCQNAKQGTPEWNNLLGPVQNLRRFVPSIAEAVAKPHWGYLYGKETAQDYISRRTAAIKQTPQPPAEADPLVPPTLAMLLPHLSDVRSTGWFLAQNARELRAQQDFVSAWQSLDTTHRMGAHLMSGHTLIEQLVGTALINLANQEMRIALYEFRDRLTATDLNLVRTSHMSTMSMDVLKPRLKGEEFFFEDVVQYVFTDDGNGNGHLIPSQYAKICTYGFMSPDDQKNAYTDASAIAAAAVHADRRETLVKYHDLFDRSVEYWSLPLYDGRRNDGNEMIKKLKDDPSESKRYALISVLLPALSRADQLIREAAQSVVATRTVVGLLSYRAEHQAMPDRLAEIAPRYLCELPTDIYSGLMLKYKRSATGEVQLYSVGFNLQDDDGSAEKLTDLSRPGAGTTADMVYWPAQ